MKLIDTHAHLDHLENLDQAFKNASEAGVIGIVSVGEGLFSNKRNLEIKKAASGTTDTKIYLGFGIHPGTIVADEVDECLDFIRENIDQAVAVGEIGLDYWYKWVRKDEDKKNEQKEVFRRQLELAKEFGLPAVIHSRGSWKDCLAICKDVGITAAIFHWYSGPVDILSEILDCGYFVSAAPSLAYSPQSREAISHAPIERVLIETDCPVRFKDGDKSFVSEPKDVFHTLKAYSELKKIDQEKAAEVFNSNAEKFFRLNDVASQG